MRYVQRIGRSLMLPVAVLPVAAILMGIGYWIDPEGWGEANIVAAFLITAGSAILDNIAILFAVGVGIGMAKNRDGAAALSALVCWLVIITILSTDSIALFQSVDPGEVDLAFDSIENVLVGIVTGIVAGAMYNRFSDVQLPDFLAF